MRCTSGHMCVHLVAEQLFEEGTARWGGAAHVLQQRHRHYAMCGRLLEAVAGAVASARLHWEHVGSDCHAVAALPLCC